jgi:predicted phage tail protein
MIVLYGKLRKKYTKSLDARIRNIGEGIRCLEANFPGFRSDIEQGNYAIIRGDTLKKGKSLDVEELPMNFSDKETFHILPIPSGKGENAGIFTIIAGVILVALSFYTGGATAAPGMKLLGVGAGLGGFVGTMGAALVLGGISMLLAPSPPDANMDARNTEDQSKSYLFGGPVNTTEPGSTVPVVYGESFIGSTFISGGLEITDIPIG